MRSSAVFVLSIRASAKSDSGYIRPLYNDLGATQSLYWEWQSESYRKGDQKQLLGYADEI